MYHDEIWDDCHFFKFVETMDYCLCHNRKTYSPEIQFIAHIYYSKFMYKNMRVDYNNPNSETNKICLYHVQLDPNRNNFTC